MKKSIGRPRSVPLPKTAESTPNLSLPVVQAGHPPVFKVERVGGSEVLSATGVEDIRLRCGKAEIVLCADGRILLRGTEILVESEGQVRIDGAYVNIN
jgi:hypothetical protein